MLIFEVIIGIITAISASAWSTGYGIYLPEKAGVVGIMLSTFVTSICLNSTFVPISLFVGIDIVKIVQAWFIGRDVEMMAPVAEPNGKLRL